MSNDRMENIIRIALQFDKAGGYARGIVGGVGQYVRSSGVAWVLELVTPADLLDDSRKWDAYISDFDNRVYFDLILKRAKPTVAVSSTRSALDNCPGQVPIVMSDNEASVRLACEHLHERGMPNFAFYCRSKYSAQPWAREREEAFRRIVAELRCDATVFEDSSAGQDALPTSQAELARWLQSLPKPCGVVAVNDSSAQELLQASVLARLSVPDEIAVVGIDNDEVAASLSRVEMSSVVQDTERIGRTAAQLLHAQLNSAHPFRSSIVVPPARLNAKASSMYLYGSNPIITRARAFIVQFANHGIKADQVAHHVGVSRSTIERLFRQECACSVHDEILRVRLDMAQNYLRAGKLSASEVAIRCGFRTLQYMHVVFKREVGCSPSEYRAGR